MNDSTKTGKRFCSVCNAEMRLVSNGKDRHGNKRYRYMCQPCHNEAVRTIYKESRDKAVEKFRKTEKFPICRAIYGARYGIKHCGVASPNSVASKRSEKNAHNHRQQWTIEGDKLVSSGKYTQGQLSKMLGRTIRAIQRRKAKLREQSDA